MLRVKHLLIGLLAVIAGTGITYGRNKSTEHQRLEPETLQYRVMYKWGLINKQAGSATLTLTHKAKNYQAKLSAKSEPWADRIFRVRDTLNGHMTYSDFTPLYYEKIAHEGNEHKHDVVRYDYSNPSRVQANCTRKVYKKDELKIDESRQMSSNGKALDMLTSFYYMRTLPFEKWKPGHVESVDIFSGKRKELLSIVYSGKVDISVNGVTRPAYHITFKFTSGGGVKTSDDMDAWIAADNTRVPLRLEGKLPVGKVHCILNE